MSTTGCFDASSVTDWLAVSIPDSLHGPPPWGAHSLMTAGSDSSGVHPHAWHVLEDVSQTAPLQSRDVEQLVAHSVPLASQV
ncbi:hypothetical protein [Sorangium sp. So ce1099]|uniref:hypothetical protein n=1 Tax=Sorangium sp. So ce1099 TaxID=3133331 RepID=UPI003F60ED8C